MVYIIMRTQMHPQGWKDERPLMVYEDEGEALHKTNELNNEWAILNKDKTRDFVSFKTVPTVYKTKGQP